jgi:hypothetical protein
MILQKCVLFAFVFICSYFIFYNYLNNRGKFSSFLGVSFLYNRNILEIYFFIFSFLYLINIFYSLFIISFFFFGEEILSPAFGRGGTGLVDFFYFYFNNLNNLIYLGVDDNLIGSINFSELIDNSSNVKSESSDSINNITDNKSNNIENNINHTEGKINNIGKDNSKDNIQTFNKNINNSARIAGDAAIMTAAISVGKTLASSGSPAVKALSIAGGVLLGGGAIAIKNISGNLSENLGKNNSYLEDMGILSDLLGLTGNTVIDFINILLLLKRIELLYLYLLIYNLILINLDLNKLEKILIKILPFNSSYIIKLLLYIQKSCKFIIIISLILLIISSIISYYYYNFFVVNFDDIIAYYIANKP